MNFVAVALAGLFLATAESDAEPVRLRIVAANLSSGSHQSYSPDNGNHSNIEGAGARILKGLKPDVILIQEFNTSTDTRLWVNTTFGTEYQFFKEAGAVIPNGIISRFPIVASGEWHDSTPLNRDYAFAKISLGNGRFLWAVSVHLKAGNASGTRQREAAELLRHLQQDIPATDYVVLGGDFNTSNRGEACLTTFGRFFRVAAPYPDDQQANSATNGPRGKPYDWLLADAELDPRQVPTKIGTIKFPSGLIFDSRDFHPLSVVVPVQPQDSAAANMQHMAVVKDFVIP